MKIRPGQIFKDRKTGDVMVINSRHHDKYWMCVFPRGRKSHKMTEFSIKKYYLAVIPNFSTYPQTEQ